MDRENKECDLCINPGGILRLRVTLVLCLDGEMEAQSKTRRSV
jgi:hypothetical protein